MCVAVVYNICQVMAWKDFPGSTTQMKLCLHVCAPHHDSVLIVCIEGLKEILVWVCGWVCIGERMQI